MIIADRVKETVENAMQGVVLTLADFEVEPQYQQALVMSLSRMVKKGALKKISKGKYYKPKESLFGTLPPVSAELVKDFLRQGGATVGYITGTHAFAEMGLTTQISSTIVVGSNRYRRPLMRGDNKIAFLLQPNPIVDEEIPLLRILDAVKLFRDIPATSPDECIRLIMNMMDALPMAQKQKLLGLAVAYTPYVRALVGAMFESIAQPELANAMRLSLNGVTNFRLPISPSVLPNKKAWRML